MKLKAWEIGLCLGLGLLILTCAIPVYQQERLAEKLTRLHVVANSDGEEDQALKLQVRDAVLAEIRPEEDVDLNQDGPFTTDWVEIIMGDSVQSVIAALEE